MKSKHHELEENAPPSEAVARCWCSTHRKPFGLVLVLVGSQGWEVRHAYSVSASYVEAECRPLQLTGTLNLQESYNGCKWCRDGSIFQCGACQSFNCQGSNRLNVVECGKCGNTGPLSGTISSFSTSHD